MQIYVDKSKYKGQEGCIIFLCKMLKNEIRSNIDVKRLSQFDAYFKTLHKDLSAKLVLKHCCQNIVYEEQTKYFTIMINQNATLHGYNLEMLVRIINFGTLQLTAYPIITKSMNEISQNINKYWFYYLNGGIYEVS